MTKEIHFTSLGCARNLVDSEVMIGILQKAGYRITDRERHADVLVVNTCGFLEAAREEAYQAIASLFAHKKSEAKVVIAGCMVKSEKENLQLRFPEIHYFLGSGDVEKILEAVNSTASGSQISSVKSYLQQGDVPRTLSTPSHYAYLKIAEGCAKSCSYCIIPQIKGPLRSRSIPEIVTEFRSLLDRGVFEVILIAQDLGDFGKDRKEKGAFEQLLRELCKEKRPFWLRLLYLYPDEISDSLIDLMASDKRICPYLDMPIQHINDRILQAMRRKSSRTEIIQTLQSLRERIPAIVIRTSLMVGFPSETEEEFQELLQFLEEHPLDNVGFFAFSPEKGSFAAKLAGQIPDEVKQRRLKKLVAVQKRMVKRRNRSYIGQVLPVIVEGYHSDTNLLMRGRFYGQCPEIDGQVVINDGRKVTAFGKLYQVVISDISDYDLIGRVL